MKKSYKIEGMDCASCASLIEMDLEDVGIKAKCSYPKALLEVEGPHNAEKVIEIVRKAGYSIK